jgi:hypothetical protein
MTGSPVGSLLFRVGGSKVIRLPHTCVWHPDMDKIWSWNSQDTRSCGHAVMRSCLSLRRMERMGREIESRLIYYSILTFLILLITTITGLFLCTSLLGIKAIRQTTFCQPTVRWPTVHRRPVHWTTVCRRPVHRTTQFIELPGSSNARFIKCQVRLG